MARVGAMTYRAAELKTADGEQLFEGDANGLVQIERTADELFSQDTLDSFVGKPITIKHPPHLVSPETWKDDSHGIILNTRRGSGPLADFIVGDIQITTDEAIGALSHLREVSCGYDAKYEKISPGRGRQSKIVGNHLALVERGRCGPNCYVGDQDMSVDEESDQMTKSELFGASLMRKLFGAATQDDAERIIAEAEADAKAATTDAAIAEIGKKVDDLAAIVQGLVTKDAEKEGDDEDEDEDDDKAETKDAVMTFDAATQPVVQTRVASAAEKLVPGHSIPALTTDAAVCECQREVLAKAYATDAGKKAIDAVLGGAVFDASAMSADMLGATFYGASHIAGLGNNAHVASILAGQAGAGAEILNASQRSIAAQKAADERWAKRREERDRHAH